MIELVAGESVRLARYAAVQANSKYCWLRAPATKFNSLQKRLQAFFNEFLLGLTSSTAPRVSCALTIEAGPQIRAVYVPESAVS